MNKLPPTPPRPPPSSSASLVLAPTASSLPPRPPPSQPVPRKPSSAIVPALPMFPTRQKRKFPPQGVGRGAGGLQGHSSLPLKPGIPGRPLPRDTEAIVLTPGDGRKGGGTPFLHDKKPYAAVAAAQQSPGMRRVEPATTTAYLHHTQTTTTSTPPPAAAAAENNTEQNHELGIPATSHHSIGAVAIEQQAFAQQNTGSAGQANRESVKTNGGPEPVSLSRNGPEMTERVVSQPQHPHVIYNPLYRHNNQLYDGAQANGFLPNGGFPHQNNHEMNHLSNGPFSTGLPPPPPPPLPSHHSHLHHQSQQGFFPHGPYNFPGNLTPPNTASFFGPPHPSHLPPSRLTEDLGPLETSMNNSDIGGSTNPQTPFTPTHIFPPSADMQFSQHPQVQGFPPPPTRHEQIHHLGQFPKQRQRPSAGQLHELAPPKSPQSESDKMQSSIVDNNPGLRNISFIAVDEDEMIGGKKMRLGSLGSVQRLVELPHSGNKIRDNLHPRFGDLPHRQYGVYENNGSGILSSAAERFQSYFLKHFLSDRLSDVRLIVRPNKDGMGWDEEEFNAHSLVLGRSSKLYGIIENSLRENKTADASLKFPDLSRTISGASWADEVEDEEAEAKSDPVNDRRTTVTLETTDKYISRSSFLLALKFLYGAGNAEVDAFLDPLHPDHRALNLTGEVHSGTGPIHLDPAMVLEEDGNSQQVRMLERSIELLAAGVLLGIDEIVYKAVWGIKTWGLTLQGEALERLLVFALEESGSLHGLEHKFKEPKGGRYGKFTENLLGDVIEFLAENLPEGFKLNPRASSSKYIFRFPEEFSQPSTGVSTPLISGKQLFNESKMNSDTYSVILLSLPFELMKAVLEHERLRIRENRKTRYDLAITVVQERERRRKRALKHVQGLQTTVEGEDHGFDGEKKQEFDEGSLQWEESAHYTFGHGGTGVELARRKKGIQGGRILWKVGEPGVKG